jgi:hypothetical protein
MDRLFIHHDREQLGLLDARQQEGLSTPDQAPTIAQLGSFSAQLPSNGGMLASNS